MHWWHGAFTSTSKSQSSSDDSIIIGSQGSSYSEQSGLFSSRRSRIMRVGKSRYVTESDVEMWRLPGNLNNSSTRVSTLASVMPHPLPLPELCVLLQRDPKYASSGHCSVPLPSPEAIHVLRGFDDKERERDRERERKEVMNTEGVDGLIEIKRLVSQDSRMYTEHSEIGPSTKSRQKQPAKEKSSDMYNINIPISAPTSPYSSFSLSPPKGDMWATKYITPPTGVFQVWSAPEMQHSDGNLGLGFSCSKRNASSVDNSPLQSPRPSTHRPPSPLTTKISSENPLRWESNAQANVHTLPLPPGAAMSSQANLIISPVGTRSDTSGASVPSQSTHVSSHTAKHEFRPSPLSPDPEVIARKSKWQKGKLIGRGTFGSVYVASNRETGALCAMKEVEILLDDSKSAECMRQLEQEIKVGDKFYIYLEYVHPGSINKFIHDHCGAITESVVRNFTRHILCGLAYLHSKKTIHRDIKGANLLVDAYGVVKLADFGMAKHLNGQTANLSLKGSPYWMAPESAAQTDASSDIALAVDIWSLGCTIIEMMNGKPPWSEYEGAAALFKVLTESPPIPNTMSVEGQDFLQCCFSRNPADRPTATKLLDHPFVSYSHHPHDCTEPLQEMKFKDNVQFVRERARHKSDQFGGKLSNSFMHGSFSPVRITNEAISSKHHI